MMKRGFGLKLLFVSKLDRYGYARGVSTISKYVQIGREMGHTIAVYGEQASEEPILPYSLDVSAFDYAIFVVYDARDFPDLPYLARLIDGMPKSRRIVIDCTGRYNDTIRVEHDFNHLERLDGHQGWEWIEGFDAVADKILQPTLTPLRPEVVPFLFHGFDREAVARPYGSMEEAARAWTGTDDSSKPYGLIYVGNNWQRWSQIAPFLEAIEPIRQQVGPICLAGWDWDQRPQWAVEHGLRGVDVDLALLERMEVETRGAIPFNEVVDFQSQARFCPIFHRPLFNHLGLVTNRTFETFCSDTIPLLMLAEELVESVHGHHARRLTVGQNVADRLEDMMRHPEVYWDAVLRTRDHLAENHSYQRRFRELQAILEG